MGLKKRQKVSAEFSMSSLTDIIFLLLIFFMLTSTVVAPNALNMKLPGSSNSTVTSNTKLDDLSIRKNGNFYLNGSRVSENQLEKKLKSLARANGREKLNVSISPTKGVHVEHVVTAMDVARRANVNAILALEK
ncbi:MAG: ExbD/TolR family protein [Saprospiraceae bacterium]